MANNRRNGGQGLALFALAIAVVGNVLVLLVSQTWATQAQKDKLERNAELNQYLRGQCERDALRDQVIVGALEDAKSRAASSIPLEAIGIRDGKRVNLRAYEVGRIQYSIDQIKQGIMSCEAEIPPR